MAKKTIFQPIDIEKYKDLGCITEDNTTRIFGIPTNTDADNIQDMLHTDSFDDWCEIQGTLENPTTDKLTGFKKAFIVPGINMSADRLKAALKEHDIHVTNDYELADVMVTDEYVADSHDSTFRTTKMLHHKTNMYMVNDGPAEDYFEETDQWMIWCDKINSNLHNCDYESAPYDFYGISGLAIELAHRIKVTGDLDVVDTETVMNSSTSIQQLTPELIEQLEGMANSHDDKELMFKLLPSIDYESEPALLWILFGKLNSEINYGYSRNKDVDWWKEKANFDKLHNMNAEHAIKYFEEKGKMDAKNFKILEPLCRQEISIHNRELYSFTVQLKPEYRKYLKTEKI
jgi:hypothetical protein